MIDEEGSGYPVALGLGHEQLVEFADQFALDLAEVASKLILRNDHAVQDLYGIDAQLVVVTETEVEYLFHKRDQCTLVSLEQSI